MERGKERRENADAEAGPDAEEDEDRECIGAVRAALNLRKEYSACSRPLCISNGTHGTASEGEEASDDEGLAAPEDIAVEGGEEGA